MYVCSSDLDNEIDNAPHTNKNILTYNLINMMTGIVLFPLPWCLIKGLMSLLS